jgi:hypothetical protein
MTLKKCDEQILPAWLFVQKSRDSLVVGWRLYTFDHAEVYKQPEHIVVTWCHNDLHPRCENHGRYPHRLDVSLHWGCRTMFYTVPSQCLTPFDAAVRNKFLLIKRCVMKYSHLYQNPCKQHKINRGRRDFNGVKHYLYVTRDKKVAAVLHRPGFRTCAAILAWIR